MEVNIETLRRHHETLYGDGNGKLGLTERTRSLEKAEERNYEMRKEWYTMKDQFNGAVKALKIIGVTLAILGGTSAAAIITQLTKIMQAVQ